MIRTILKVKKEVDAFEEWLLMQIFSQQKKEEVSHSSLLYGCLLITLMLALGLAAFYWGAIKLYLIRGLRRLTRLLEGGAADQALNNQHQLVADYDQPRVNQQRQYIERPVNNDQEPEKVGNTENATIPFIKKKYTRGGAAACRFGYDQLLAKQSMLPAVANSSGMKTKAPIPNAGSPINPYGKTEYKSGSKGSHQT